MNLQGRHFLGCDGLRQLVGRNKRSALRRLCLTECFGHVEIARQVSRIKSSSRQDGAMRSAYCAPRI